MIPAINVGGRLALPLDRLLLTAIFIGGLLFYTSLQIHHDVAWYVYCNFRQLEGLKPYVDFVEVNPPISFYLTMLPVLASKATGLPVNFCLVSYVLLLTAGALWLGLAIDGAPDMERRWKRVGLAAILMVVPICVFAQREHFAVVFGLPYFYLCAARLRGQKVTLRLAITAGLMAGIGFSIKHYFLLAPLMVELYLIYRSRTLRTLLRPEIAAAILVGLLYALLAFIFHREYFTVTVPLILAAYGAYSRPLWFIALLPWNMAVLAGLAFWLLARRHIAKAPNADLFFVAALAFVFCVIWQNKGWAYHSLPAELMLCFAALELLAPALSGRAVVSGLGRRQKWTIPAAPIILIVLQTLISGPYRNPLAQDAAQYVDRYAPRGTMFVMSSNLSTGFPLALETNVTWASRFATQWLLPEVIRGEQDTVNLTEKRRAELKWLAAYDIDATVADFEKFKPDIVFVDTYYQSGPSRLFNGISVDLIAYYQRDPRFAAIWKQYRKVGSLTADITQDERTLEVWIK